MKKPILIILCLLVVVGLGVGGYFLFKKEKNPNNATTSKGPITSKGQESIAGTTPSVNELKKTSVTAIQKNPMPSVLKSGPKGKTIGNELSYYG